MSERELNPQIREFLERLKRLDAGGRARLKRNAGKAMGESREALALFYSVLPFGVSPAQEDRYFLVATLYPLCDGGGKGNLGDALRRARSLRNSKGIDRRVEILLDADDTQFPFRLRQAIRFLQSSRVRVSWERLLDDVLRWNYANRPVQRQWARSYFAEERKTTQTNPSN